MLTSRCSSRLGRYPRAPRYSSVVAPRSIGSASRDSGSLSVPRGTSALNSTADATLHLLHVVDNIQIATFLEAYGDVAGKMQEEVEAAAREEIDKRLIDSDGSGPKTTGAVVTSLTPVSAIVEYAKDHRIDLIVMG